MFDPDVVEWRFARAILIEVRTDPFPVTIGAELAYALSRLDPLGMGSKDKERDSFEEAIKIAAAVADTGSR